MLTDADVKVREKLRKAAMEAAERAREEGEGEGAEGGGKFARGEGMQVCRFTLRAVKERLFEIS